MLAVIDTKHLVGGLVVSLLVVYLTSGLFSDARSLQIKWGGDGEGKSRVPLSRLSRIPTILVWTLVAGSLFARAFHFYEDVAHDIFMPAFFTLFVLTFLSAVRDYRNFKKRNGHGR